MPVAPMLVAPSRGRGLKQSCHNAKMLWQGRPFTGAWIETPPPAISKSSLKRRPFTGAWIETNFRSRGGIGGIGRPFTGAWIETFVESFHCGTV